MNQSEFPATTSILLKAREKTREKGFDFASRWLKKLMRQFLVIAKRRHRNRVLDYFRQSIKNCSMQRVYIFSFAKLSLS